MNNDSISALNNYLQALGKESSLVWLDSKEGPEHAPEWTSICKIDNEQIATGRGPQKNLARDAAARQALAILQRDG